MGTGAILPSGVLTSSFSLPFTEKIDQSPPTCHSRSFIIYVLYHVQYVRFGKDHVHKEKMRMLKPFVHTVMQTGNLTVTCCHTCAQMATAKTNLYESPTAN